VGSADLEALVRVALDDDLDRLLGAAASEIGSPLGLVGRGGEPLGYAPDDERGRRALAVAEAAARAGLAAPPGWHVRPLARGLGFIGVGGDGHPLLDIASGLLAEQVQRLQLVRAHHADFVRRLVLEAPAEVAQLRREAYELGMPLASAYWTALLGCRDATPRIRLADAVAGAAAGVEGALAVDLTGRWVLLQPADGNGHAPPPWFEQAVLRTRRTAPGCGAQAIVAREPAALDALSATVAELDAFWRYGARAADEPLVSAERFALDRLLAPVARGREARAFVQEQVGLLVDWDAAHRGDLLRVLEAALDHPRHDHAAQRCFMHRNTFRHRLRQAAAIVGRDLDDPDVRLAVHVALKLRRLQ
jgi:sugar diacid utilization regulator